MSNTKLSLMRKLEAAGLSFTVNVIMNGCSKPVTKMKTLVALLDAGCDVRHAQFETCQVVVDGRAVWLGELDKGAAAVRGAA